MHTHNLFFFKLFSVFCLLFIFLFSEKIFSAEKETELTLLLDWKPNTNHTGFFVADKLGFYKQHHLKIKILNPTAVTSTTLVGMQKADFSVTYPHDLIYAVSAGVPIVAIAAIVQQDTSCFVWKKSAKIQSIADFEGKRYGGWGSPEEEQTLKDLMERNGASFSKIKTLFIGERGFSAVITGSVDFTWEYKNWNILAAELQGIATETYCPAEHFPEFDKPSPLLITSKNLLQQKRQIVTAFLSATAEGFSYAEDHPEHAAEILLKQNTGLDRRLVLESSKRLSPLYRNGRQRWGELDIVRLSRYATWMKKRGLVKTLPPFNSFLHDPLKK